MKTSKFKMTEIGEIPADWEVKRLGGVGSFSKGAGISRAQANSGKIPAVRYGELYTTHHNYIKRFESFISDEVAKESTQLTYGDIVFACSGETKEEIGKCAAFLGSEVAYAGGDLIILSPRNGYDSKFLAFELNAPFCALQKASAGQGDAVVHIRRESLENLIVVIPSLAEQKAIAEALSDVDALIAAQEELIEKKRAIKQGAMQELLTGKKRLPGFGGKWIEKRLGDCATMFAGGTPSSKIEGYYGGDIPWVSISDISIAGKYIERTAETLSDAGLNNSSAKWYPPNALLFAMYASIGKCCIAKERMTSSQAILGIYDLIDIDVEFLYYLLTFRNDEFLMMGQTGTQSNLSKAIVEEIVINTPSLAEQKAIAEVLSDMDAEISELEAQKAKFESIKQGMMQELLTGKTRLV